jgi:hypothetical protein
MIVLIAIGVLIVVAIYGTIDVLKQTKKLK